MRFERKVHQIEDETWAESNCAQLICSACHCWLGPLRENAQRLNRSHTVPQHGTAQRTERKLCGTWETRWDAPNLNLSPVSFFGAGQLFRPLLSTYESRIHMRPNVDVATRGTVEAMKLRALSLVFLANRSSLSMNASFRSFVVGLGLSVPLL